ncbi:MAG: sigma-70 family RNA polymerase sigma factor [Pseudomonadota bacterium]
MSNREQKWQDWMRAARLGDRAAYSALLSDIAERVRRFSRRRLARSGLGLEEVEDIVQDVLVALHTKRDTWDPSRPLAPWVDAIIRYKTTDALRKLKRRAIVTDTLDAVAETIAATPSIFQTGALVDLDRHLRLLPSRERGVVMALSVEGLSVSGCASRLGITEGAVRVAFHRGLSRLEGAAEQEPAAARPQKGMAR